MVQGFLLVLWLSKGFFQASVAGVVDMCRAFIGMCKGLYPACCIGKCLKGFVGVWLGIVFQV